MNVFKIIYFAVGILYGLGGAFFIVSSILEKKQRAVLSSYIITGLFILGWFGGGLILDIGITASILLSLLILLLTALFFIPIGKNSTIDISETDERVDERDIMFAREEYAPGESKYETYYFLNPESKMIDDKIRNLPKLLTPGGRYYVPGQSEYISSIFHIIRSLTDKVDGEISENQKVSDQDEISSFLKQAIKKMGADDVGITDLNPAYVYSHVGRGPQPWGSEIKNNHRYAIMFTLEMEYDKVESAPGLPITHETAVRYFECAMISIEIARYIRSLGYSARAHIAGSNYQIMLPPVAYDAGLGELGRMGYLISPRFGARIRLGGVTTDLPLLTDKPVSFGVQDFCEKCLKCAFNCPSSAISKKKKERVRGVSKWPLNIEKCMLYWRIAGTDCGLCMKTCPYSHPPTLIHNIVRKTISRSAVARRIAIHADDLLYGRKAEY